MTEQQSLVVSSSSSVVDTEVRNEKARDKNPNVKCTEILVARKRLISYGKPSIPEIDSDDERATSPSSPCLTLMQTPEQEQTCSRHLIVADTVERKNASKKRNLSPASSSQREQILYTVASYDPALEYKELEPKTLAWHYGEVTPYGTVAHSSVESDGRAASRISDTKAPNRNSDSSFSTSIYSSLLRATDSGVHKVKLGQRGIYYIDFLPTKKKENFYKNDEYLGFDDCINLANTWLSENKCAVPNRCESLRHRLDHSHQFNPESTAAHDRSYVVGLRKNRYRDKGFALRSRLWYYLEKEENDVKLAYRNFVPRQKEAAAKTTDHPLLEDLPTTVNRMNEELKDNPLNGYLLDLETLSANCAQIYLPNGKLNPDACYCCLESQDKWEIFFLRLFFVEDAPQQCSPNFEYKDFVPKPLTLPPSRIQFQTMSSVISEANDWLCHQTQKQICSVEILDMTFRKEMLGSSKECANPNNSWHRSSKSSSKQHCLKTLRIWMVEKANKSENALQRDGLQPEDVGFDLLTFVPRQLTTSGCCGANKALFASSRDTVGKIHDWMNCSGAEIVDIQTDNVEKWQASSCNIHTYLPERTYAKEDYKNPAFRSALECRLTVFRVYYRPKSLGHLYTPNPDKPVEPCCCFVGCTIM